MKAKFVFESTNNYWPGYSDDGTADGLSYIRKKTSKIQNDELRSKEKEVLDNKLGVESGIDEPEERAFFQKWMYANMILTSLQDGFYIDADLLDKALSLYTEIIQDPNIDEYMVGTKTPGYFQDTIELILTKLSHELQDNGKEIYAPGFLDKDDEDRIRIDNRFEKYK